MQQRKFKTRTADIEVRKLMLHTGANREPIASRVRELERNMDLDAVSPFAVWRDRNNLYVIDGQHRKLALESLGLGEWKVTCLVFEGASFADACDLFLKWNHGRAVSSYEKFDKSVKSGYEAEVETRKVVEAAGFRVSNVVKDGNLTCVKAATETWGLDRGDSLKIGLDLTVSSWGHTAAAVDGHIVRGLGLFAFLTNGEVDYASLAQKLGKYPGGANKVLGDAKARRDHSGGAIGRNVAEVVRAVYNKGRRNGQLPPL